MSSAANTIHFFSNLIRHYLLPTPRGTLQVPFISDLYLSCIKRQAKVKTLEAIELSRKELEKDLTVFEFVDPGAGAHTSQTKKATIASVARQNLKPGRIAGVLYHLVKKYRYVNIIELGTSLGVTTSYFAEALKTFAKPAEVHFSTIEGVETVYGKAKEVFEKLDLKDYVEAVEGNFDVVLPELLKHYPKIDLLFIDGNHTYQATCRYFKQCLPLAGNESVFIFDDIYWSKGMTKAWEEIKNHGQVTMSVDLFFIGLVYFRKEEVKQHFKLKIL